MRLDPKQIVEEARKVGLIGFAGPVTLPPPKPPKVVKPKAVKAPKVAKPRIVIERKPIVIKRVERPANAPRVDAGTIWPAHIKPVCRMMPPGRYEASVPFQRIGQPGFAMSI